MRLAALCMACATLVTGCTFGHGEFEPTPCKPAGEPTHGTLRVQVPLDHPYTEGVTPVGKCVALQQGDKVLATARFGADGNATINVPVAGEVYLTWTEPMPRDKACAEHAYVFVHVPGPANVTLRPGAMCY